MSIAPTPTFVAVEPPELDLTAEDLVARAVALRPLLRREQDATDARGYFSAEIDEACREAGFSRILQPRRFGGYELDVRTFYKVMIEIGRGCPSSGWCMATGSGHAISLATYWPEDAQAEIFGSEGYFRAPHRVIPQGKAVPTDGGYLLSGRWDFCSGIPYATHFLGNAVVADGGQPDGRPRIVSVFVPVGSYTILDNWGGDATLGLRGSGSNSVVMENVFVPERHAVTGNWFAMDEVPADLPGPQLHENPIYGGRLAGFYEGEITSAIVGAAHAAVDEFEQIITTRPHTFDPTIKRYEHYDYQRVYGLGRATAEAAESVLLGLADRFAELAAKSAHDRTGFTYQDDCWLFAQAQQAGKLASEAIHIVYNGAGSSAAQGNSKMARYLRDASMFDSHVAQQYESSASGVARAHFGLRPGPLG